MHPFFRKDSSLEKKILILVKEDGIKFHKECDNKGFIINILYYII